MQPAACHRARFFSTLKGAKLPDGKGSGRLQSLHDSGGMLTRKLPLIFSLGLLAFPVSLGASVGVFSLLLEK